MSRVPRPGPRRPNKAWPSNSRPRMDFKNMFQGAQDRFPSSFKTPSPFDQANENKKTQMSIAPQRFRPATAHRRDAVRPKWGPSRGPPAGFLPDPPQWASQKAVKFNNKPDRYEQFTAQSYPSPPPPPPPPPKTTTEQPTTPRPPKRTTSRRPRKRPRTTTTTTTTTKRPTTRRRPRPRTTTTPAPPTTSPKEIVVHNSKERPGCTKIYRREDVDGEAYVVAACSLLAMRFKYGQSKESSI